MRKEIVLDQWRDVLDIMFEKDKESILEKLWIMKLIEADLQLLI